jgi:uncharacterized Zn-binding protein involved in type VI secretion
MIVADILIDTTVGNGTSLSSNLFGYIGNYHNSLPESDLEDTYTLYVYGAQHIGTEYDGTPIYRRYSIDSITSINTSQLAPNLNVSIDPFTYSDNDWSVQAFTITFTGSLSRASNGAVSMTYRDGLNSPVTTNNFNSFPSTASLTSIRSPKGDEYIPLEFSLVSEGKTYPLQTPLYVEHEGVNFPTQTAPKAATRQGDKEIDHGYAVKSASQGSPDVFIDGIAAHTTGHSWPDHNKGDSWHESRSTSTGSDSVYINGEALARVSNSISCGSKIAQGSETVFSG